jgi:UDP-3-O-[3-hydroxymyristoyl] glucosamine N-acyltransferase
MSHSILKIAKHLGGDVEGDTSLTLTGLAEFEQAQADQLCFAESEQYLDALSASSAGAAIVSRQFPEVAGKALIRVDNPRLGFIQAMELFAPDRSFVGVHESASVAPSARLGDAVGVGPNVVIEEGAKIGSSVSIRAGAYIGAAAIIGDGCDIGPNVSILDGCQIGNNCLLHPGVCIGADGYGFRWLQDHHHKIPQLGIVVVEDNVEIGANSCIDRATMGETRIGAGTKIDNLVHIAHNNKIGKHVIMTALVGIAGSSEIGDGAILAGQAGVIDHVKLGKGVQVGAKALVTKDFDDNAKVWGIPARSLSNTKKQIASLIKLPNVFRQLRRQNKELAELRARLEQLEKTGV